jgi:hypothetical protein
MFWFKEKLQKMKLSSYFNKRMNTNTKTLSLAFVTKTNNKKLSGTSIKISLDNSVNCLLKLVCIYAANCIFLQIILYDVRCVMITVI